MTLRSPLGHARPSGPVPLPPPCSFAQPGVLPVRLAAGLGIEVLDVLVGAVHERLEVGKDAWWVVVEDRLDLAVDAFPLLSVKRLATLDQQVVHLVVREVL